MPIINNPAESGRIPIPLPTEVVEWKGATPLDLVEGRVQADGDVRAWRGETPNALSDGRVEAVADVELWQNEHAPALVNGRLPAEANVATWLGAAPGPLVSGRVPSSADLASWGGERIPGLVGGRVKASTPGVITGGPLKTWPLTSPGYRPQFGANAGQWGVPVRTDIPSSTDELVTRILFGPSRYLVGLFGRISAGPARAPDEDLAEVMLIGEGMNSNPSAAVGFTSRDLHHPVLIPAGKYAWVSIMQAVGTGATAPQIWLEAVRVSYLDDAPWSRATRPAPTPDEPGRLRRLARRLTGRGAS
jgi:hypothetical protein